MASVRVRRSNYSSLREQSEAADPNSRRLSITRWPGTAPATSAGDPSTSSDAPTGTLTRRSLFRPRSESVVEGQCIPRQSPTIPPRRSPFLNSNSSTPTTPVISPVQPEPGYGGSAVSLAQSHDTTIPVEILGGGDHHHDNIVEHLDVIGASGSSSNCLTSNCSPQTHKLQLCPI
jgi:hypothetical protein